MFYAKPATRNNFDICKKYLTSSDVNYILHPVSKCLMQLTVDDDTEIVPQCYETVHRKTGAIYPWSSVNSLHVLTVIQIVLLVSYTYTPSTTMSRSTCPIMGMVRCRHSIIIQSHDNARSIQH